MAEQKPVPWERGSRGSRLSLGIKYRKEVRNGKLVNIDPRTGEKVTRKAHGLYIKERKAELDAKTSKYQKRNREALATVSKTLFPTTSDLVERATRTGKHKLSEVPISNFDPQTVKDEGLEGKTYLTVPEADRLFRRQELEGRIQQAKFNTDNEREIRLRAQSKSPKIRTNLAGDDNFGLGIGPVDPKWMPSGMEVGTQVDGIPQGPLDKPITTTTKEKTDDTNKVINKELKIAEKQSAFTPRSDVFTIDPATGEAVGVLTRNQRKNFEAREDVQKALKATPKNELRIYKNRTGAG